ncbi:MAG: hypothetical protein WCB58_23090 [Acidobacteriaceae bacterium]
MLLRKGSIELSGDDGRGTLEVRPETGSPGDVALQIDVAAQVTARWAGQDCSDKVCGTPAEEQRATEIRGTLDNKEQQRGERQCEDRPGKEDSEQMQAGGGAAAEESGEQGDDTRDELPT